MKRSCVHCEKSRHEGWMLKCEPCGATLCYQCILGHVRKCKKAESDKAMAFIRYEGMKAQRRRVEK